MRMLMIEEDTDLKTLRTRLVDGRLGDDRAEAALRDLQALNPHVDLTRLPAGTVLLVPESSDFKPSASASIAGAVVENLRDVIRSGLETTAARLKSGNEARNTEADDTAAVVKSRAVKRLLESDPELEEQVRNAIVVFKDERRQAEEAERTLEELTSGAMAEVAALEKLLG